MVDIKFWYRRLKYLYTALFFKSIGYDMGKFVMVGCGSTIVRRGFKAGDCVHIGKYSYIGPNVRFGNFCMLSDYVNFIGSEHVYDMVGVPSILAGRPTEYGTTPVTEVGDDVWIGHGVTVIRGVKLGEGCIIGANSVVTKDVEPYAVVVGVPAKKVRDRFSAEERDEHAAFLERYRKGGVVLLHDRKPVFRQV